MPAEVPLGERQRAVLDAARALLVEEGADALTMGRIARALGIKPPSLYKHFADLTAIEALLVAEGFELWVAELEAAGPTLAEIGIAYRAFARAHPQLYELMTDRPLARERLPAGLEARAQAPLLAAAGDDQDRARALWAFAHGMVSLELAGRFPPSADPDRAWVVGLEGLAP